MNSRLAASVAPRLVATAALGAAIAFGATGCTFMTHQATTNVYPASDGVNIASTGGPVEVRNAMVIANEDGSTGNLVAALINPTLDDADLVIEVDGTPLDETVTIPAGETISLGANAEPLRIDGLNVMPGATVEIYFSSGEPGEATAVPVLDGTLPYYADLTPEEELVVEGGE